MTNDANTVFNSVRDAASSFIWTLFLLSGMFPAETEQCSITKCWLFISGCLHRDTCLKNMNKVTRFTRCFTPACASPADDCSCCCLSLLLIVAFSCDSKTTDCCTEGSEHAAVCLRWKLHISDYQIWSCSALFDLYNQPTSFYLNIRVFLAAFIPNDCILSYCAFKLHLFWLALTICSSLSFLIRLVHPLPVL